jgi:hypothetical protein
MELRADARLAFPRPLVYATYRDRLVDLVPYLPNVRRIETKSRTQEPGVIRMVNVWHGGGEIPAAARAVLSEAMLSWTDHAQWNESDWTCAWRIETHAFTDAVNCKGTNRFIESADGTVLEIRGVLEIDARKIKGVPGFMAGSVGRTVESFLLSKIQPNLVQVSDGIRQFLSKS